MVENERQLTGEEREKLEKQIIQLGKEMQAASLTHSLEQARIAQLKRDGRWGVRDLDTGFQAAAIFFRMQGMMDVLNGLLGRGESVDEIIGNLAMQVREIEKGPITRVMINNENLPGGGMHN